MRSSEDECDIDDDLRSYRGTSLIRDSAAIRPYGRTMPRVSWWSEGGWLFLMDKR